MWGLTREWDLQTHTEAESFIPSMKCWAVEQNKNNPTEKDWRLL